MEQRAFWKYLMGLNAAPKLLEGQRYHIGLVHPRETHANHCEDDDKRWRYRYRIVY